MSERVTKLDRKPVKPKPVPSGSPLEDNLIWLRNMGAAKVQTIKRERFNAAADELEALRKKVQELEEDNTNIQLELDLGPKE